MGIRKYNPTTPGLRGMTVSTFEEITTSTPEKSLTVTLKKHAGRNVRGKITVRHRGGGTRAKYRIIDFKRNKDDIPATVKSIEYDPNRSANIALVCYADGEKRYIIAPNKLKVGDVIALHDTSKSSQKFKDVVEQTADRTVPLWLDVNKEAFSATVTRMPVPEDLDYEVAAHLIVELYSK